MIKQIATYIIDHDKKFIELVKQALSRANNLTFAGSASNKDDISTFCYESNTNLVLLNIDFQNPGYIEIIDLIRKNIPESYIILMNQDDKKFANYTPDDKIADDYLDKNYLFEEIIKISNSFDQVLNNELINEYS